MMKTFGLYGLWVFLIVLCVTAGLEAVPEQQKRDDVLTVLLRMEARQIADVHPRLFKHSMMDGFCDSAEFCRLLQKHYDAPSEIRPSREKFLDAVEALKGKEFRGRLEVATTPPKESSGK